jgi:two-component system response regulator LytT
VLHEINKTYNYKQMKCIVLDDEELSRLILKKQISKFKDLNLIGDFSNAMEAIKFLNQTNVDLIFLDIHMPDFSGFDFLQTLKNPPKIILVTSDRNFAIEAFEYDCVIDYILKPLCYDRLHKAILKAKNSLINNAEQNINLPEKHQNEELENELYVNIDRKLIKIEFDSIKIVEAKGDYIHIKTETKNYIVHSTLKKIEEKLPKDLFLKVHRSYIINFKKIIDIEDNTVLIGKEVIPLSRYNRPELMSRLNLL